MNTNTYRRSFFCPKNLLVVLSGVTILLFFMTIIEVDLSSKVGSFVGLLMGGGDGKELGDSMGLDLTFSLFALASGWKMKGLLGEFYKDEAPAFISIFLVLLVSITLIVLFILMNNRNFRVMSILNAVFGGILFIVMVGARIIIAGYDEYGIIDFNFAWYMYVLCSGTILILSILIATKKLEVYSFSSEINSDRFYRGVAKIRQKAQNSYRDFEERTRPENYAGDNQYNPNNSSNPHNYAADINGQHQGLENNVHSQLDNANNGFVQQQAEQNIDNGQLDNYQNIDDSQQNDFGDVGDTKRIDDVVDAQRPQQGQVDPEPQISTNTPPESRGAIESTNNGNAQDIIPNFCPNCGTKIGTGEFFCGNCGYKLI